MRAMPEYIGEFPAATEMDRQATILWLRYYVDTELYDRSLPGAFFRPGEWMPYPEGRPASMRFAAKCMRDLKWRAAEARIPGDEMSRARNYVLGLSFDRQRAELAYLLGSDAQPASDAAKGKD